MHNPLVPSLSPMSEASLSIITPKDQALPSSSLSLQFTIFPLCLIYISLDFGVIKFGKLYVCAYLQTYTCTRLITYSSPLCVWNKFVNLDHHKISNGFEQQKVSTSAPRWKYHVFLSFRGEDTRKGITGHLFEELNERSIDAFMDERGLGKGTTINKELKQEIERSRFSIVIISKNYASSKWCLLELAHIVRCMEEDGRLIMPIFYGVEPSDVRHQTGTFAKHFTEHERLGIDGEKVREWRDALTKVGNLVGWNSKNYSQDTALIENIVEEVWKKVYTSKIAGPSQKSVGRKVKKIDLLLNPDANDIRFIGIWGADETGIKATAQFLHTRISGNFEVSSFLRDIRNDSKLKSLVYLQEQLLKELNGRPIPVSDVYVGKLKTQDCVRDKMVLRILDDVDQSDQIEILGGEKNWYGNGSRIIITSMDRHLLKKAIKEPHNLVEGFNKEEGLQFYS